MDHIGAQTKEFTISDDFKEYVEEVLVLDERDGPEPVCPFGAWGECWYIPKARHEVCLICESSQKAYRKHRKKIGEI